LGTKKDIEQKISKYDKTNGAVTRRFGRRNSTKTELRLNYIPSKAALKQGSEVWIFK
jgi:hypothetical protein